MMPARNNFSQNWLPSIFNDFFDNDWIAKANATAPAINVIESEKAYKVELAVPGMQKEDFKIHVTEDNMLVISMEKKDEKKSEDGQKYLRREFNYTQFEQSMLLPDDVDKEQIGASAKDGILTIELPKICVKEEPVTCKVIEIK